MTYFINEEDTLKKRYIKAYPYIQLENGYRISEAEKELELIRRVLRRVIDPSEDYLTSVPDSEVLRLFIQRTSK